MTQYDIVYKKLLFAYGHQNWWPIIINGGSEYLSEFNKRRRTSMERLEICLGAILTQNTNWKNVEASLIVLKESGSMNVQQLADISRQELAYIIRSSGYFNQKAKKIKNFIKFIQYRLSGDIDNLDRLDLPEARNALLSVWGIGRETADSMLLYAFDRPVFIVDAYTRRIFYRLGYIDGDEEYDDIRYQIEYDLPQDILIYKEYHGLLVKHAKLFCRKKPVCEECPIQGLCLFYESEG